ncbi:MAG TPA: orotidine-5'-phosphate decarboxylase [Clostridia bacterium]
MIDKLIEKIKQTDNPSVIGLDTDVSYLPQDMLDKIVTLEDAAQAVTEFNKNIIDAIHNVAPAVKVQVAYYEQLGVAGMKAFAYTLAYAKQKGMITIADVKRNDIGSTASAYSKAFFGGVEIKGKRLVGFEADFVTVNGYLGSDGLKPFIKDCEKHDKGIFVLVKTSNPSSAELQDRTLSDGKTFYELVGELVRDLGKDLVGEYGYSKVGAVVGATHPKQAKVLRELFPSVFFLVPGYGAQGGTAEDLKVCFDQNGLGAIVNSSRGIICAYQKDKYKGMHYAEAALQACIEMREDLNKVIK